MNFRNDYKIAFFDVDGTTVITSEGFVRQPAAEALRRLKAAGVTVALATGRPLVHLKRVEQVVDFTYKVTINGNCVLDQNNEMIYGAPLQPDTFEKIRAYADEKDAGLAFHFLENTYVYNRYDRIAWHYDNRTLEKNEVYTDCPSQDRHQNGSRYAYPYNAVLVVDDEEDMLRFAEENDLKTDRPWPYVFDVFRSGQSKARGIEEVLKKEGLRWEDVVVFGDSSNDIEMLQKAGLGVCMGNGCDEAKAAADYVCGRIEEDGLAKAIRDIFRV